MKKALLLLGIIWAGTAHAGDTAASCPSVKSNTPSVVFAAVASAKNTMLKVPLSVAGDGSRTWIRFPKEAPWAIPFVRLKDGKDLHLSWRNDGECMVVALGEQDFHIGYKGEEADIRRVARAGK